MTPPDAPRLAPVIRGFAAWQIAAFCRERGLLASLPPRVHPRYRAELEAALTDLDAIGEQWRDWRASLQVGTSATGTTEVPERPDPASSWLTATQAAEELGGVTDRWVRQLLASGELQGEKDRGSWRVRRSEVEDFVARRASGVAA